MNQMIVSVRDKMLRRVGGVSHFVTHNKDYEIQFQFDDSWTDVRHKMAVFAYEDGEYRSEIFDGDVCGVPELPRVGKIYVGIKVGDELSTELLCVQVCKSADDVITDEYDVPDPKIYEQILDIMNNLWGGGDTVYPSPVKFLAAPSTAKVGDLIRVKEVDENGYVEKTDGFDIDAALEKKIDAPGSATVGDMLIVEEVGENGKPKKWKTAPGVNITTELTQESTDAQVPSAKAAYDAIQNATDKDAVRFVAQELTDEQKEQARKNINATPKLFYLPNEKIASSIKFTSPTSGSIHCKFENVLLSLHNGTNQFSTGESYLYIDKTENADGSVQFKARSNLQNYKPNSIECKKYYGDLYIVSIVYGRDDIDSLYALASGCLMNASIIDHATQDFPGVIKVDAQEYDEALYNPLTTSNGYAVSYNEIAITTAQNVGTVFRRQKAKAILVTDDNIQTFADGGFHAPYFMVQLRTRFDDGIITNDYMVMAPAGVFFAIGVMSIRGTSNTVSWQINSEKFGMSLSMISSALNNLYVNSLRPPTTAQPGQIVRVKSVDDNGNITETEAADFSGSISVTYDEETGNLQIGD